MCPSVHEPPPLLIQSSALQTCGPPPSFSGDVCQQYFFLFLFLIYNENGMYIISILFYYLFDEKWLKVLEFFLKKIIERNLL